MSQATEEQVQKIAALVGTASSQADLAALLSRRSSVQAADDDYDRRLREVQAREKFGDAWPAPAEAEDDGVEIRIDSPTTIYQAPAPATPAASAVGALGKLALGAALVAGGGGAGAGASYLANLLTKPPPAAAAPAPVDASTQYTLELVP